MIMYPVVVILLIVTLLQGKQLMALMLVDGLMFQLLGSFQPSTLASLVLMVFVARYLSKSNF